MSGKGAVDRQTDDIASTTVLGVPRDPRAPRDKHPGSRSLSLSQHYKARGQHQFKFVLLLACKTT